VLLYAALVRLQGPGKLEQEEEEEDEDEDEGPSNACNLVRAQRALSGYLCQALSGYLVLALSGSLM